MHYKLTIPCSKKYVKNPLVCKPWYSQIKKYNYLQLRHMHKLPQIGTEKG